MGDQHFETNKAVQQSHPFLFTNSLKGIILQGNFRNIEWWQKCIDREGDFVGKCTDLTAGWCFPIHMFT